MNIEKIAEYVWINSQIVEFGNDKSWNKDLFTSKWIKGKKFR